jgi:hypothetical protein
MTFEALLFQALNGLAAASSLFFVGAGLSMIFGVTRIVNIAHGSFSCVICGHLGHRRMRFGADHRRRGGAALGLIEIRCCAGLSGSGTVQLLATSRWFSSSTTWRSTSGA